MLPPYRIVVKVADVTATDGSLCVCLHIAAGTAKGGIAL